MSYVSSFFTTVTCYVTVVIVEFTGINKDRFGWIGVDEIKIMWEEIYI